MKQAAFMFFMEVGGEWSKVPSVVGCRAVKQCFFYKG